MTNPKKSDILQSKGAAASGLAPPNLISVRNRHRAGWRFLLLILIVTVIPKICNVIVIGMAFTSSRRE